MLRLLLQKDKFSFNALQAAFPDRRLVVCLALVAVTLAAYWEVKQYPFISFDDGLYVYENPYVNKGLSAEGIIWAFRLEEKKDTHWHPLAWISHMVDITLYGLNAGGHHVTSLILHTVGAVGLFLFLDMATGSLWPSAAVAGLFALHPVNVDSVVWIAQRKNVLSTFFMMFALMAYAYYDKKPRIISYLMVAMLLSLGLMSKPMLVTLPFVFLLLDFWPFNRFRWATRKSTWGSAGKTDRFPSTPAGRLRSDNLKLVLEKIPYLALTLGVIYMSYTTFRNSGVAMPAEMVPIGLRFANAVISYVKYIGKLAYPINLAVFYPYPDKVMLWQLAGSALVLLVITAIVGRTAGSRPFLLTGWLWFLGMLVPAAGIFQVGLWPALADRFVYVPQIGLFMGVVWAAYHWKGTNRKTARGLTVAISIVVFVSLFIATKQQVRIWADSRTLFEHVLRVSPRNFLAHFHIGLDLAQKKRWQEAIDHYHEALRICPGLFKANYNLGRAYDALGQKGKAIGHYQRELRLNPTYIPAYNNLALLFLRAGMNETGINILKQALEIDSNAAVVRQNLNRALTLKSKAQTK
jgi:hypothetical protein